MNVSESAQIGVAGALILLKGVSFVIPQPPKFNFSGINVNVTLGMTGESKLFKSLYNWKFI